MTEMVPITEMSSCAIIDKRADVQCGGLLAWQHFRPSPEAAPRVTGSPTASPGATHRSVACGRVSPPCPWAGTHADSGLRTYRLLHVCSSADSMPRSCPGRGRVLEATTGTLVDFAPETHRAPGPTPRSTWLEPVRGRPVIVDQSVEGAQIPAGHRHFLSQSSVAALQR